MAARKLLLILLIIVFSIPVYAEDISATGYASTASEAQDRAKEKLMELVFGTSVSTITSIGLYEDNAGYSESSFYNSVSTFSYGDLLGIRYTQAKKSLDNKIEVTAFIEESSSALYEMEMKSLSKEIRNEYEKYKHATVSIEDKKDCLINLLNMFSKFTNYRQVLIMLGKTETIPEIPVDETYKSLSDQLYSIYTELMNLEEEKKNNSSYSDIVEINAKIEKLKAEQDAAKAASDQSLVEQRLIYEQGIRESISKVIESSVLGATSITKGYSIAEDLKTVEECIRLYNDITEQYEARLSEVRSRNANELEKGVASIKSREYELAELSNGQPTELALAMRNYEVKEFTNLKHTELEEQKNLITSLFRDEIQRLYDSMAQNCLMVESREYKVSTADSDTSWARKAWDGEKNCWIIVFDNPYLSSFSCNLGYSTLTGKEPPSIPKTGEFSEEVMKQYDSFKIAVNEYDSELGKGRMLDFEFSLSITIDVHSGKALFEMERAVLSVKTNTGSRSIEISVETDPSTLVAIGDSANDISYSWLQKNPSFNKKADSINAQRQKEKEKEERRNESKIEAEGLISSLIGKTKRFMYIPMLKNSIDENYADDCFVLVYDWGFEIKYSLSERILIGLEPSIGLRFINRGGNYDYSNGESSSETKLSYGVFADIGYYHALINHKNSAYSGKSIEGIALGYAIRFGLTDSGLVFNPYFRMIILRCVFDVGFSLSRDGFAMTLGLGYAF